MTKKHFIAYAAAVRRHYETAKRMNEPMVLRGLSVAAEEFAAIAASDNPRFDRVRFLSACGVI